MTPSCTTQVTTQTGRFTFYFKKMSICEAKKFCAEKNEILAPITNRNDFDAVKKIIKAGNHPGCQFYDFDSDYLIGLDITPLW